MPKDDENFLEKMWEGKEYAYLKVKIVDVKAFSEITDYCLGSKKDVPLLGALVEEVAWARPQEHQVGEELGKFLIEMFNQRKLPANVVTYIREH